MGDHLKQRAGKPTVSQIPIRPSLGILGKKWTARILADIGFRRVNRFGQLLDSNPGLTRRMLSKRLRELEAESFIKRKVMDRRRNEVTWSLAPKGRETLPILMDLLVFGSRWNSPYRFSGRLPSLASIERR